MTAVLAGFVATVDEQRRINARTWAAMYLGVLGVSAVLGILTIRSAPAPFALPFTMLLVASIVVAAKPIAGIYLAAFFTLFTDASISPWYPFAKNLSSRESILYVSDAISASPLELLLAVTATAWLLHLLIDRGGTTFVRGALFRPIMVFTAFLFVGFVLGLATGGDRYAAIWEFRPFLYLPITYVLVTNLFTSRRQYHRLAAVMLVALVAQGLLGLQVWSYLSAAERKGLESLVDHGSAIQMSVVLIAALAVWLLPKAPASMRWLLPLAAIPIGWVWLVSQRRAAVIGVGVGVILLGILLAKLSPRRLRIIGPVFVLVTVAYLGAFWQSESSLGFPAQAAKTVIAPSEISNKDQSSDSYRVVENHDIGATLQAKPITGLGFGQKFLRPVPLPDISFFPFFEYIPHNSILWIWIKAGFGGFVAMLFLFGSAVRMGVRTTLRVPEERDLVLAFAATVYVVMYLVFAYVDIAWDGRSMISLAVAMAVCSELSRLPSRQDEPRAPLSGRVWAPAPGSLSRSATG